MTRTLVTPEEFESAAMPHMGDLFRTALRVMGDRAVAEDLVQETYLQAWKSFHRFEPGTNCRAWLYKILFHVINHHRRKWFKFEWVKEGEALLEATLMYEPSVPEELTDEEILAAFQKVPERYREVVMLADVHELSYKEIAVALNIPMGTVMSRLNRGRAILRVELAKCAESYGIRAWNQSLERARA
ncbi:MAG: sigma-70 family RNA polymerase sigma factor [Acidobacteriota bacterium]